MCKNKNGFLCSYECKNVCSHDLKSYLDEEKSYLYTNKNQMYMYLKS